ncbi:hypothetical protein [Bacillus ndiopicus]|uniref:hypothetical protein n=1 Tax=Bacillus ndiopicus TaxID=1347368 RepID=UPI0005AB286A|nr:hypothetical protein [Bacillus ndiopicus]
MNSVISILLIGLIISQLIIYYLIILLNNKVSKFKDLEVRQDQLMQEMDNAIGVYLIEMREENDRLLRELTVKSTTSVANQQRIVEQEVATTLEIKNEQLSETILKEPMQIEKKAFVPKNVAASVYKQHKIKEPSAPKQEPITLEQQIITMHKNGQSIEEIAKQTQKGKTEIELLIKFHS